MQIGNLNIPHAIILAPMEDVTDISFRLICKRLGADLMYTEFVNSEGLIRNSEKTKLKMLFLPEERPIGIQIYGNLATSMKRAAQIAEELQPDLIDINAGCWVRKVVGRGAGAGLLREPVTMRQIISSVVKAVKLPVTVKTRLGWDDKSIQIVDVAKMVEDAGAQALTIHCRTRAQGQKGSPDYSLIPEVKRAVKIPIIVNGGIESAEIAKNVFDTTGCDGVMLARGAINNPFIFREIKHYLSTGNLLPPSSLSERIQLLMEYLQLAVHYKGERKACYEVRKHYGGYLRDYPGISKLRAELNQMTALQPILDKLNQLNETIRNEPATV
ncbi:MAG: tRNA dihydrouridine synthase DusB [Bacteroidota bacterium]|nr:tRNA dihydrouridine synthase DusB [Bacteroidota bacterium]